MKTKIATLAITALLMVGCDGVKKANDSPQEAETDIETSNPSKNEVSNSDKTMTLENTKWLITTLEGGDMSDREKNGQDIYFVLDSETNRINGNSGCNTFMGTYKIEDGNRISFSEMASTRMLCPDAKINEQQILDIFNTADNYTLTNETLALNKAKRASLAEFKSVPMANEPIVEKYWKLKTLEGKAITMAENQEREVYFMLKANDNAVKGFAGCNTLGGQYTLEEGNRIRFSNMLTTLKICEDVDFNETEFLKIFELADNYTITDDELSLNIGRRAPLATFEAVYF